MEPCPLCNGKGPNVVRLPLEDTCPYCDSTGLVQQGRYATCYICNYPEPANDIDECGRCSECVGHLKGNATEPY